MISVMFVWRRPRGLPWFFFRWRQRDEIIGRRATWIVLGPFELRVF